MHLSQAFIFAPQKNNNRMGADVPVNWELQRLHVRDSTWPAGGGRHSERQSLGTRPFIDRLLKQKNVNDMNPFLSTWRIFTLHSANSQFSSGLRITSL